MFSKILFSLSPFLSFLAPACSKSTPVELTVFGSMMSANPYRPPRSTDSDPKKIDPEEMDFDKTIRVMSFNIRSDDDPNHLWEERKSSVASMIRFHRADLIGLQEPNQNQLNDLTNSLPEFESYSGAPLGENKIYDPIFFRKSRFEMLDSGYFFLSPTPDLPTKGWEAKFIRAASWVQLLDRNTKMKFFLFNTHFDYHSRLARDESARLLKAKIQDITGKSTFIVTGDFNLFPKLGGQATYDILTDPTSSKSFFDAQSLALFPHHGPTGTWSGFKEAGQPGIKPDCIFVSPEIQVCLHGVLADSFDGRFPSDHLPVVADLIISNETVSL